MVANQVYVFLYTLLIGVVMGIIFDFFRALRRNGNTKNIVVYIQDIIFWIIIALVIIVSSFLINDGELRGYMLFGYILGALIYMLLFSKYIKTLFEMIFDLFAKIFFNMTKPILKLVKKLEKNNKNAQTSRSLNENVE